MFVRFVDVTESTRPQLENLTLETFTHILFVSSAEFPPGYTKISLPSLSDLTLAPRPAPMSVRFLLSNILGDLNVSPSDNMIAPPK